MKNLIGALTEQCQRASFCFTAWIAQLISCAVLWLQEWGRFENAGGRVKKYLFGSAAVVLSIGCGSANAGDTAAAPPPFAAPYSSFPTSYSWSGFYGGVTAGAALGQYNAQTSTVGGAYMDAASAAAVSAAGAQSIKPTGFTTGIEGGYNWQIGNLLLGVEADLQAFISMARRTAAQARIRERRRANLLPSRPMATATGCSRRGRASGSWPPITGCSTPPAGSR